MSRIFLSHSSLDEREALAVREWLAENGWDDVFLDVDPQRGLAAGERWQQALRDAADRCEAVVILISPAWAASKWCLAEFLLAKSLGKRVFGVVLRQTPPEDLPRELTTEWQLCSLVGEFGQTDRIRFTRGEATDEVDFLSAGLLRLREGLDRAGLAATHFPWPPASDPQRSPYRGLEPLDAADAAVFFGRDAEILHGLDILRGLRSGGAARLFVILGASGAGKSSFLRAGLLPRLAREDRQFLPLVPVRPERDPIAGERGLAHALHEAQTALKVSQIALGALKADLRNDPAALGPIIDSLRSAARRRLVTQSSSAPAPTLIVSIDQAEELFGADAAEDAARLLQSLGTALRRDPKAEAAEADLIVVFTIRSDRYASLQTAPELTGVQGFVFDQLKPMPSTRFRDVITGPARRSTEAGRRLLVQPALTNQLVDECQHGGDTLPLLSLTLARLHRDFGRDGELKLDDYRDMGGLAKIVKSEVESVLARDTETRAAQLDLLRSAFVPWLATVNVQTGQALRRVARLEHLPAQSRSLIAALSDRRLLLTDRRDGDTMVEVAHEALLRQWDLLAQWLAEERNRLQEADALEQAARDWMESKRQSAWLIEGERLETAEALASMAGYAKRLEACREFLAASRERETQRRAEKEHAAQAALEAARRLTAEQQTRADAEGRAREEAERSARGLRIWQRLLVAALVGVAAAGVVAFWQAETASDERSTAVAERKRAETALATTERELLRAQTAELRGLILRIDRLLAEAPPKGHERLQNERRSLQERLAKTVAEHQKRLAAAIGFRGDFGFLQRWEGNVGGVKLIGNSATIDPQTDLSFIKPEVVRQRYEFLLTLDELEGVLALASVRGERVQEIWRAHPALCRITIQPADVARLVPEVAGNYWLRLVKQYPEVEDLEVNAATHTALLSLVFNLGLNKRFFEPLMTALRAKDAAAMAQAIDRAHADMGLVARNPYLQRRRTAEANLIREAAGIAVTAPVQSPTAVVDRLDAKDCS